MDNYDLGAKAPGTPLLSSKGYLYHQLLNMYLLDNPLKDLNDLFSSLHISLSFRPESHWFCLTGLKKEFYTGIYGYDADRYLRIFFNPLRHRLLKLIHACGWAADVFLVLDSNRKQIGIIMSPVQENAASPGQVAVQINEAVQQKYCRSLKQPNPLYSCVTALSDRQEGYGIQTGYRQARRLNDLSFFHMRPDVLSEQTLQKFLRPADFQVVIENCQKVCHFMDMGQPHAMKKQLGQLLFRLKNAYNFSLFADALSYFKHALLKRCTIWNVAGQIDLEKLCRTESYLCIKDCATALLPVLERLSAAAAQHGCYPAIVLDAAYYIKTHYREDISIPDIAFYSGVTPNYLSNIFRESTGLSLRSFVTECRMRTAKSLLCEGGQSVAAIAEAVGFHDAKYFTRIFKNLTGMSPSQYREKQRQLSG